MWYPVEADICGEYSSDLSDAIEAELGISTQDQRWVSNEKTTIR